MPAYVPKWFHLGSIDLKSTGDKGFLIPAQAGGHKLTAWRAKLVITSSTDSEVLVPAVVSVGTNSSSFDNLVNSAVIGDPVLDHPNELTLVTTGRLALTSGLKCVVEVAATGITTLVAELWVEAVVKL